MCGIAGIWGDGKIQPMIDILTHRGPDEEGKFEKGKVKLGIRRLKVIDLVTGSQPIFNEDKSIVVVFNGEIFNYRELKEDLIKLGHQFSTKSDTEVIVHSYEQWGEKCLSRFNGQFAFCIYDGNKLFMARDRMGEKPLYYYLKDGRLIFASEIKAILTQLKTEPEIDESFWVFDSPIMGKTIFKDIHEVPQATYLVYDGKKLKRKNYWKIPNEPVFESEKILIETLRDLLEDAVKIRMHADVPVGLFLSGGLDSAAMACLANPDIVFTCRFNLGDKFDEFHFSKIVAEHIGARQIVVSPTADDMRKRLSNIIWHLDQPISTASSLSEFILAEEARKSVKVILGGQGADELFGGYVRYVLMSIEENLSKQPELENYHSLAKFFWSKQIFENPAKRYYHLIHRATPVLDKPYIKMVQELFDYQKNSLINAMGYSDIYLSLPSLITMNDRASAASGLENRCPFLDHRLVEFAFRLPNGLKIRELKTKYLLRKAMRGIVPDPILDRKDKKGLVVPFQQWLSGPLYLWGKELEASLQRRIVVPGKSGRGEFDRGLYTRVCMELWFQNFFPDYAQR